MGKRSITYACGHIETVQLYGPHQQREYRAKRLAESECGTCWKAQQDRERAEQSERSAAANRAAGLPALEGAPKQVDWAETIRATMLQGLDHEQTRLTERGPVREVADEVSDFWARRLEHIGTARAALSEIASARWFIDHRDMGAINLAAMAARGQLVPRTAGQKAAGFDPFDLNRLEFPAAEVAGWTPDGRCVRLQLVHSRWEGCTVDHPASMADTAPDGKVVIRFGGNWTISVDDGARTREVSAEAFHLDRMRRRTEPGERHYWGTPPYASGEWNEVDVPEGDVSEQEERGKRVAVVQLACSRWEGLHFLHPVKLTRRHRPGFVTLRFGPQWEVKILGGERMLRVRGHEMYEDRAAPLPEPGESLAVEQKTWHGVTFHPSQVRRGKDTWWIRLAPETDWPDAVVFHPQRLCRQRKDGSVTWRFHEDWRFRVRTPDSGTVEISAQEFVTTTSDWADTAPLPGKYTRDPADLAPADEVAIPVELLEDDALLDDEG